MTSFFVWYPIINVNWHWNDYWGTKERKKSWKWKSFWNFSIMKGFFAWATKERKGNYSAKFLGWNFQEQIFCPCFYLYEDGWVEKDQKQYCNETLH